MCEVKDWNKNSVFQPSCIPTFAGDPKRSTSELVFKFRVGTAHWKVKDKLKEVSAPWVKGGCLDDKLWKGSSFTVFFTSENLIFFLKVPL